MISKEILVRVMLNRRGLGSSEKGEKRKRQAGERYKRKVRREARERGKIRNGFGKTGK